MWKNEYDSSKSSKHGMSTGMKGAQIEHDPFALLNLEESTHPTQN